MIWTERELQQYREQVCNDEVQHVDTCEACTKTKEEITECFMDLLNDVILEDTNENAYWATKDIVCGNGEEL